MRNDAAPPTPGVLRSEVERLVGCEPAARYGVAVSGGPDSMALLLLAAEAFPGRVAAATVDHGLREESAGEAALVARACGVMGVAHSVLLPPFPITGSIQSAARAGRYAALEGWRAEQRLDWLLTAHHADDQLETLVMRLNRSSGLAGLSGIRERQGRLLRPLLGVRRAALRTFVEERGTPFVDDPANRDPRFDRARVRHALSASDLIDAGAAAASAAHLAQEEEALCWATQELMRTRFGIGDAGATLDVGGLPRALCRRLLIAALTELGESAPRGAAADRAMESLAAGERTMLGATTISPERSVWRFAPAPPRRAGPRGGPTVR